MKVLNIFKILLTAVLLAVIVLLPNATKAQCRTDLLLGQTAVLNGDFSQNYSAWNFTPDTDGDLTTPAGSPDGYKIFTGGFSVPGNIYVGTGADMFGFNNAFNKPFNGHTTGAAGDKFLMVDGVCVVGIKLWRQANIPVIPNTRYYFSVWINSLKDQASYPGLLNFDVDGVNLIGPGSIIQAPNTGGGSVGGAWKKVETFWDSGPTPPATVTISIEGNQTIGCGGASGESDFAIDDISFVPGCSYGDPGPQPDLGPDQTLCGKGGSITLDANVPHLASTTVTWSDGTTGTGLGAPYTKIISTPGTYSVCVVDGSSCIKSDVIVITNTFSINIGGPYNFCSSSSQVLDAGFTGIGTTYKWYKGGVLVPYPNDTKTYTATSAGTYRVDVTVPGCGTQSSTTTITSTAPVTPIDAYYCATLGPVNGLTISATNPNSANLNWYTVATGGTAIASGVTTPNGTTSTYTLPSIAMGTTATQIYYVEDATVTTGSVGPTALITTGTSGNAIYDIIGNGYGMYFSGTQNFKINSFQLPIRITSSTGSNMTVSFNYTILKSDGTALTTPITGTTSSVVVPMGTSAFTLFTFNLTGVNIPFTVDGPNYQLRITGRTSSYGSDDYRWEVEKRTSLASTPFPIASAAPLSGMVSITNSYIYGPQPTAYSGIYNWGISAVTPCSRTPVRAISNCPTPVTWTSFYLIPKDNNCKLVWSTADETNNDYFSIERSIDGIHFETIATTKGGGNRDFASNYYYVDNAPVSGTSYYRITQHDYDGKFSSTEIKPYSTEGLIQVTTYPNPFQHNTTLLVSGSTNETYIYNMYSVSGQLVETGTGTLNQTQTIAETQAKGMYMLTVLTGTDIITTKIVKQ